MQQTLHLLSVLVVSIIVTGVVLGAGAAAKEPSPPVSPPASGAQMGFRLLYPLPALAQESTPGSAFAPSSVLLLGKNASFLTVNPKLGMPSRATF